jgi:hypothetical protein
MSNENKIENVEIEEKKIYTKEKIGESGQKRRHRSHRVSTSSSTVRKKKKFKLFQNSKERKAATALLLAAVIVLLLAIPLFTFLFEAIEKIVQTNP